MVTDLSVGGCRIEKADAAVEGKAFLTLRLRLSYHEAPILIDVAVVRWSNGEDFGLEFVSIRAAERDRLQQYIDKLGL